MSSAFGLALLDNQNDPETVLEKVGKHVDSIGL